MSAKMLFDPFGLVLEVFGELHPNKSATIVWRQRIQSGTGICYGCTEYDHNPPLVSVDVELPVIGAVDVLAHELAHVAAGARAGHGKHWRAAFDAIYQRYSERVDAMEGGLDVQVNTPPEQDKVTP